VIERPFDGRVALVTGAASGIGEAVTARLVADGARVVAFDRSSFTGSAAPGVQRVEGDVRSATDVRRAVEIAISSFGGLHVLCNVAGVIQTNAVLSEVTDDEYDRVMDTNVKGVFLGMRHGIPAIIESGGGAVVNVASIGGLVGRVGVSTYAASKGAVIQLSKSAALEYAREGVRVNVVCPGPTKTNLSRDVAAVSSASDRVGVLARTTEAVPLRRFSEPSEIAGPIVFLAGPDASFMVGAVVVVDGGLTVGMPGQLPRDPVASAGRT
jgi:NAD(P)-dependent dehydrogenase (short-subunit alcohol dehydrogenase family)